MYRYIFEMENGDILKFDTPKTIKPQKILPDWTRLAYHQCPNCPLSIDEVSHCPAAIDVVDIIATFKKYRSYDKTQVKVISKQREYSKNCDIQTAVNSLLGLVMANCQCPYLAKFKLMSKYHLPFSSLEESILRSLSFYLIEQFIASTKNKQPDWTLQTLFHRYEELKIVNTYFVKRINDYEDHNDAHINSVVRFFTLSSLMEISLDKIVDDLQIEY